MRQRRAEFLVLRIVDLAFGRCELVTGVGFEGGRDDVVLELRVAHLQLRGACRPRQRENALGTDVVLLDVLVLSLERVELERVAFEDLHVLALVAVGAGVEGRERCAHRAERTGERRVEGVVRAVARVALELARASEGTVGVEEVGALLLGVVASLHVGPERVAPVAERAAKDAAQRALELVVVEHQAAGAQIATVDLVVPLEHDVECAADAFGGAVGTRAAHDLDALDELGGDAVDEERPIGLRAGHLAAVDQDLRVTRVETAQANRIELEHVRQEGDARHPLQHVADGERLEPLEVVETVLEHRRGRLDPVAIDDLSQHDDLLERLIVTGRGRLRVRWTDGGCERHGNGGVYGSALDSRHGCPLAYLSGAGNHAFVTFL